MGKTTNYQLPYPESSDRVKLGAINMKALANAVDVELKKLADAVQPVSFFDLAPTIASKMSVDYMKIYYNASTATLLFRGLKNNGGAPAWFVPPETIPSKLRPPNMVPVPVFSGNVIGRVYVSNNGSLACYGFMQGKGYDGSVSWAI